MARAKKKKAAVSCNARQTKILEAIMIIEDLYKTIQSGDDYEYLEKMGLAYCNGESYSITTKGRKLLEEIK